MKTCDDILNLLVDAYDRFTTVEKPGADDPFYAFAKYDLSTEDSGAKSEDREFVFIARADELTSDILATLDKTSWDRGEALVTPSFNHKNSNVTLIIVSDRLGPGDVQSQISSAKHSKSYKLGLQGTCNFKLAVVEAQTKELYFNAQAIQFEDFLSGIVKFWEDD